VTYLERIFPGETLVTVVTRERLDGQMYSFMPLQIVVSIEALWALVTLERSVVRSWLLVRWVAKEVRHCRSVAAIEARHHSRVHAD
jgi:hypothetical protein